MPLFPRAANPASEFQAVLELARASATRHAVADIEDGNYAAALAKLDALASGSFHWRGAVSNGYEQGFFLYALRGYCLETLGEVVKAYRSYQNSRACFDDETAAVQCSEPRLEVFLGLGRTCLVAGRYTDAFNWLDLVRLEASAMPRLAAAADRALIRRAIEIGDYHDALTNFWDLQCLLRECGSDLRVANAALDEESGRGSPSHTNRNQCAENDHFVRSERILSRQEHKDLAQLYFWTGRNRDGFDTLAWGFLILGPMETAELDDGLLSLYVNYLARSEYQDCDRLYALLGGCIARARGVAGDEQYLARLLSMRSEMRRILPNLAPEDDLAKLRSRLEQVASNLCARLPDSTPKKTMRSIEQSYKKAEFAAAQHNYTASAIEDCVMNAGILIKRGAHSAAIKLAHATLSLQVSNISWNQAYDGSCIGSVLSAIFGNSLVD